jgi:hypothetical protein
MFSALHHFTVAPFCGSVAGKHAPLDVLFARSGRCFSGSGAQTFPESSGLCSHMGILTDIGQSVKRSATSKDIRPRLAVIWRRAEPARDSWWRRLPLRAPVQTLVLPPTWEAVREVQLMLTRPANSHGLLRPVASF